MNSLNRILIFLATTALLFACQKDPLKEVNDGDWNKEKNIIGITFNGQVGNATVTRDGDKGTIRFTYNTATSDDFSAIAITELEISYGATASVSVGKTLNFENAKDSAVITITPVHGKPMDWTITLTPFTETLLGTWSITGLVVYGGTGAQYGGAGVVEMTDKSWCWNATTGPAAEKDNALTFTLTGINDAGNTYGTIINAAGSDGLYADFTFTYTDPDVDVNGFYRKIPKGTGTWEHNYSAGTVIFTFSDGTKTTGVLVEAGVKSFTDSDGTAFTKTVNDLSFEFSLSGTDDWSSIYSDYDKFVKNPKRYWIDITKSK
jgi:hypothetical protein